MARRAVIASLVAGLAAAKNFTFNIRSDGNGDFSSVQAALDFIDPLSQPGGTCSGLVTLNIEGVFFERINVYSNFTGGVVFRGTGSSPMDSFLVYNESGVISGGGTFKSWTVKVDAPDVHFVNLAIANNASDYDAKIAGQSVALHLTADRFACWNCSLLGSQDTLYTGEPGIRSYFSNNYINGSCDALFGGSSSVFTGCTIDMSFTVTAHRGNGSTAYLITDSEVTTPAGAVVQLGRPWGEDARVVFKNTRMSGGVEPLAWDDWGHNCTKGHSSWCNTVFYAEYNSTGAGADPAARPWWTFQLNASQAEQWTAATVLRDWIPVVPA